MDTKVGSLTGSGTVVLGSGITLTTGGDNTSPVAFSGAITDVDGSGGFTKTGTGTETLTGTNTYGGTTTITAGTLQIGNGGTTGAIGSGAIANSASLVFDLTSNTTLSNAISGNGTIFNIGSGTLTFAGTNSGSGGTTVSNGSAVISNAGNIGSGLISLANDTSLQYTGGMGTLGQNITVTSGSATVNNAGGATLTLSGTLTKDDTNLILNAGGGTINVTGAIVSTGAVGAFDSDLYVTNGTIIADDSNNNYSGPTHIYGGATLQNGFDNALPTDTVVELGNSDATALKAARPTRTPTN